MKKQTNEQMLEELKIKVNESQQAYQKLEELNKELSKANQKLIESEQLKSNFLSNARNEIINPLTSILSLSQTIAFLKNSDTEQARSLATIIYKEAFELDFQMNNIFISAEIEAGEAYCEYYNIDLVDLLEKQIKKFENLALDKSLVLVLENNLADASRNMKSDPSKIQVIISNLIVNSINWSENAGNIIIRLSSEGDQKIISIIDNGPGISKKDQKIIFDRFKSIDPTVYTKNKGHGLGLSIVKAFAELLNGEIKIESTPGKGSTFSLIFTDAPLGEETQGSSMSGQDFLFDDESELF